MKDIRSNSKGFAVALFLLILAAGVWQLAHTPAFPAIEALHPDIYRVPGNPYPHGLNLIFFADGYLSRNEFEADSHLLLDEMRRYEPWKSFERYNVYGVFPGENDICGLKTQDERHPVLRCDPDRVNAYLNLIPTGWFRVVFLSRRPFESWANVTRGEQGTIHFSMTGSYPDPGQQAALGVQFAHLMGHAFGLKDEEYFMIAKADSAAHVPDGPNCAPDRATAEKWWGDLVGLDSRVGYFGGCNGSKEYIRPTEGSLMNLNELGKFVPDYGPVSDRYLRKVLAICFSGQGSDQNDAFFISYPEFRSCI